MHTYSTFNYLAVEAQLGVWREKSINISQLDEHLCEKAARSLSVFVYRIDGCHVTVDEKPVHQQEADGGAALAPYAQRAEIFRVMLTDAIKDHGIETCVILAIDCGDLADDCRDYPLFSFQKKRGSAIILLPDIEIESMGYEPHPACSSIPYMDKKNKAEFYGSTTGKLPITFDDAIAASTPRLSAYRYFQNEGDVEFKLPNIVQCESDQVVQLLRDQGMGGQRQEYNDGFGCKFAISIDGNGAACSRPFLALHSTSVLLKYDSDFILYWSDFLVPYLHYLPVKNHSDVLLFIQREAKSPGSYRYVSDNGASFLNRNVNRKESRGYIALLLQAYADLVLKQNKTENFLNEERSKMAYPTNLDQIGVRYRTDKSSIEHDYLSFYEERLGHLKEESFTMVEIGVFKGGSLRTWGEYFSNAQIVGLDIDPSTKGYTEGNKHVYIGDASRSEVADYVVKQHGRPLIVLDDGSHIWHHQIESLRYFWPKILPGGFFIMEDIHTSMPGQIDAFPWYAGDSSISAYDYIMQMNRLVVGTSDMGDEKPYDGFIGNYSPTVRSIEWYRRTCIIRKKIDVSEPPHE